MNLKNFFEAKRIAVIGAAREEHKVGHIIFKNLIKNKNLQVFPVNPNADKILGVKCLADVSSIPYPVDLAVIAVPAKIVSNILEQCGKKEIKNAIIISAGFEETGNNLGANVKKIAEKHGISLLGPNVLGAINTYKNFNASFFSGDLEKGNVAFVSQSGALGTAILDKANSELGISSFISLGNMLNIDFNSALEYLEKDLYSEVILLYIESLKPESGKKFIELCLRISKRKKIIVLKSGKTDEGEKAAKTHTASLSSDARIYSGAFKQAGIIEVSSLEEMFFLAKLYSRHKELGRKACVVSNAGGLGVLAVDACVEAGLQMKEIPENVLKELDKILPFGYSRANPLDILGDALAERYEKVLKLLEKYFDFFIVLLTPQAMTQALETAKILVKIKKPVIACFVGGKSLNESISLLKKENILVLDDVSKLAWLGV